MDWLLRGFVVSKVHSDALKLLSQVGLEINDEALRKQLIATGKAKETGNRISLDEETVEEFAEELRERSLSVNSAEGDSHKRQRFTVSVSGWPMFFVEPKSNDLKPFSADALIEYTRLVDAFREDGVGGSAPGTPQDVPPKIRQLLQYYIECRYSRGAGFPGCIGDVQVMEFMIEMAKAMRHPIGVGVEPFSPLTFEGNSVKVALRFQEQVKWIGLDTMPILGISAPLNWHSGWAQSVAENLGGYTIFRLLGFEHIYPSFRLFPGSMKSATIAFGSPEFLLALLMRSQIRQFYGQSIGDAESLHTMAKLPDAHALAEKSTQTAFAALLGHRSFSAAGVLAIDEVFSPQQLVIDLEIRDYVERLIQGADVNTEDCLSLVSEGLQNHCFLMTQRTMESWRDFFWLPKIFLQTSRAQWQQSPRSVLEDAWSLAQERLKKHHYELDPDRRRALDAIVQKAKETLL